ncbi:MAG: protein rep [Clostridia bacterium]|nr:protein rep [Clostridia bacterium]
MQLNNNTEFSQSQEKILQKTMVKKRYNENVITWLEAHGYYDKANNIRDCATFLGITEVDGFPKIVRANFCRERLCYVCAWRRQSKFQAQMFPVMEILSQEHDFLFVTLTLKNSSRENLKADVDLLLSSYDRLLKRQRVKQSFCGVCRSLEVTYNAKTDTFHPHLHLLVAVPKNYFSCDDYISQDELCSLWRKVARLDYTPIVWIEKVSQGNKAVCETLKYSLKPSAFAQSYEIFLNILKGRRLISFSGVFADLRKQLKYSSFEDVLTDDVNVKGKNIFYNLYKFDATGGVYKFFEKYTLVADGG